jgi:hypothetical protein
MWNKCLLKTLSVLEMETGLGLLISGTPWIPETDVLLMALTSTKEEGDGLERDYRPAQLPTASYFVCHFRDDVHLVFLVRESSFRKRECSAFAMLFIFRETIFGSI